MDASLTSHTPRVTVAAVVCPRPAAVPALSRHACRGYADCLRCASSPGNFPCSTEKYHTFSYRTMRASQAVRGLLVQQCMGVR